MSNSTHLHSMESMSQGTSSGAIVTFLRRIQATLVALDANANPRLALETLMLDVPTT